MKTGLTLSYCLFRFSSISSLQFCSCLSRVELEDVILWYVYVFVGQCVVLQIRNKDTGMCLDTFGRKAGEKVGMADCHGLGGNQVCFHLYYTALTPIVGVRCVLSPVLIYSGHRCVFLPVLHLHNTAIGEFYRMYHTCFGCLLWIWSTTVRSMSAIPKLRY